MFLYIWCYSDPTDVACCDDHLLDWESKRSHMLEKPEARTTCRITTMIEDMFHWTPIKLVE